MGTVIFIHTHTYAKYQQINQQKALGTIIGFFVIVLFSFSCGLLSEINVIYCLIH